MSTTLNDEHWLNLITQCRSSGLTDRQWCIENGIPVSTFYYHVRAEYSGQFYTVIPEVGNRRSDVKETVIPEPWKPWFLTL